ncbi:MAG: OmpA family protein [Gammaproteobacteria bacterium]
MSTMLHIAGIRRALPPLLAGLMLLTNITGVAFADQVKVFTGAPPSAEELANMLFPERVEQAASQNTGRAETGPRTRSIVFTDQQPPQPASQKRPEGFGLLINFAYNSATILPNSQPYLDQVADMLKLDGVAGKRIVIEGHTDSKGNAAYNLRLSQRRAQAVKQYLVAKHQIDPGVLLAAGKGESEPLPGHRPGDTANRRVEFHRSYR